MEHIEIMQVLEQERFFGIVTTYAVSERETLEVKKEMILNKIQLN